MKGLLTGQMELPAEVTSCLLSYILLVKSKSGILGQEEGSTQGYKQQESCPRTQLRIGLYVAVHSAFGGA